MGVCFATVKLGRFCQDEKLTKAMSRVSDYAAICKLRLIGEIEGTGTLMSPAWIEREPIASKLLRSF
jgi:hypothetical protein